MNHVVRARVRRLFQNQRQSQISSMAKLIFFCFKPLLNYYQRKKYGNNQFILVLVLNCTKEVNSLYSVASRCKPCFFVLKEICFEDI